MMCIEGQHVQSPSLVKARIDELADHLWRSRNLKTTSLVPLLEAAQCFRDQCRREKGVDTESDALAWFWDRFAAALLNGDFDGDEKVFVLDNPGIFGTRRRFESEYGYRLTSDHMRELTGPAYKYDVVVERCLARSWCSVRTAAGWCERLGLPLPRRWQAPKADSQPLDRQSRPSSEFAATAVAKRECQPAEIKEEPPTEIQRQAAKRGPIDRSKHLVAEVKRQRELSPDNSLEEVIKKVLDDAALRDPSARLPAAETLRRRYYGTK